MTDFVLHHEAVIRSGLFIGIFLLFALWERLRPRRHQQVPPRQRWPANLAIVLLNSLAVRVLLPVAAVGVAWKAESAGWGLLNQLNWPLWLTTVLAFVLLDFVIYLQHRLFHRIPVFWRLHRMHHADPEIDVSTGVRFHPIEILLSMLIKMVVVLAAGAPPVAVVLFEVVLNATSLFNHSNIVLPDRLDRWLRMLLVTPDYHRVHHSRIRKETDSNFGFNLSCWDRLLGTYRAQPELGHMGMQIGLDGFSDDARETGLWRMLTQPFRQPRQQD